MGSSHYTYIGALIEYEDTPIQRIKTSTMCPTCNVVQYSPFCPSCGTRIISREVSYQDFIDIYEALRGLLDDDYRIIPDTTYITPNSDTKFSFTTEDSGELYPIPQPASEEDFMDIISVLNSKGIKYTLKYGIYSYWA